MNLLHFLSLLTVVTTVLPNQVYGAYENRERELMMKMMMMKKPTAAPTVSPAPTITVDLTDPLLRPEVLRLAIQLRMPALLRAHKVDGASVGFMYGGKTFWKQGFGKASITTDAPYESETISQQAGIAVTLTAWAVMKMLSEKNIGLDEPVQDYITNWTIPDPRNYNRDGVTFRRLLSHTAGIGLWGYTGFVSKVPDTITGLNNQKEGCCLDKNSWSLTGDGDTKIIFPPGSTQRYSGGGYQMLQLSLEQNLEKPFADIMRELLDSLNMTSSGFWAYPIGNNTVAAKTATARCRKNNANCRPYRDKQDRVPNYVFSSSAAAGFYSNADDMLKFLQANIAPPQGTINATTLNEMWVEAPFEAPIPGVSEPYGLGYELTNVTVAYGNNQTRNEQMVYHSGWNIGWQCEFAIVPEAEVGITVSTNGDTGGAVVAEIIGLFLSWLNGDLPPTKEGVLTALQNELLTALKHTRVAATLSQKWRDGGY